jgi:glycosyltransferase involved in cell wall biosynthesis
MKVVHLTTAHEPSDVRIFHKECCSLAEAGYNVILVCPSNAISNNSNNKGVLIDPISEPKNRKERMTRTVYQACDIALAHKADLYHFHDPELIRIVPRLKRSGAKVVYDSHEDVRAQIRTKEWIPKWIRGFIARGFGTFEDYAVSRLDAIVAATPHIARRFPRAKTVVVNNYPLQGEIINCDPNYTGRQSTITYVGGISRIRGALEMVRAIEIICRDYDYDVHLTVVGGIESSDLQADLINLPGWEYVEYMGRQPRDIAIGCMSSARAGLVVYHPAPNHMYAQPNKLFEYMACGIPVVASNFPYWRDIVDSVGCGLLVDPQDPWAIAEAVKWLLDHPDEAELMGRRGREAVIHEYNWESQIPILVRLYERLLS